MQVFDEAPPTKPWPTSARIVCRGDTVGRDAVIVGLGQEAG